LLVQSHAVEPKRDQVLAALAKEPEPIRRAYLKADAEDQQGG
jgi:hypothetical protein